MLVYISTAQPLYYLFDTVFGGDARPWGQLLSVLFEHLFVTFYNRISGYSLRWYHDRFVEYSETIRVRLESQAHFIEQQYADGTYMGILGRVSIPPW